MQVASQPVVQSNHPGKPELCNTYSQVSLAERDSGDVLRGRRLQVVWAHPPVLCAVLQLHASANRTKDEWSAGCCRAR